MACQRFRRAVHHQVVAQPNGVLQDGSGKRVVDQRDEMVLVGERHGFFNVHQTQRGIGRRFDVQRACACVDELFDAAKIGLDMVNSNAQVGKHVAHEPVRAAVKLRRGDQLVSSLQHRQKRGGNRRHARSGHHRGLRAFERRNFLFRHAQRWIPVARVNVGFVLALGPLLHFFRVGKGEGRGADNFGDDRTVHTVALRLPAMNGSGLRPELALQA